jgi:hypothetical protein
MVQEETWGGPLWAAADLITPMAVRVAATLRVADAITAAAQDEAPDPLVASRDPQMSRSGVNVVAGRRVPQWAQTTGGWEAVKA